MVPYVGAPEIKARRLVLAIRYHSHIGNPGLLKISDRNASDFETTLNFTGYPRLITECWRLLIVQNSAYAYISEYGRAAYRDHLRQSHWFTEFVRGDGIYGDPYDDTVDEDVVEGKTAGDTGYFNFPQEKVDSRGFTESLHEKWEPLRVKDGSLPSLLRLIRLGKGRILMLCYPVLFYRLRRFLPLLVGLDILVHRGLRNFGEAVWEYVRYQAQRLFRSRPSALVFRAKSLRLAVRDDYENLSDDPAMVELRRGR